MAVCNIMALYSYGACDSLLREAWREGCKTISIGDEEVDGAPVPTANDQPPALLGPSQAENTPHGGSESPPTQSTQEISFGVSKRLDFTVLSLTLYRIDNDSVTPHWHVWMVFLSHIIGSMPAARLIETDFPSVALVKMLNRLLVPQLGDDANIRAQNPITIHHPLQTPPHRAAASTLSYRRPGLHPCR